jgi:hypothetical protein
MRRVRRMPEPRRRGPLTDNEALWLHEVMARARRADDMGAELAAAHLLDSYARRERVSISDLGRCIDFDTPHPIGCC